MSRFSQQEIDYLQTSRLGRIATVDQKGTLDVVPVGFRYSPDEDTIDIGGHNIVATKKFRDALKHGRIAFELDGVPPPRWFRGKAMKGARLFMCVAYGVPLAMARRAKLCVGKS